MADDVVLGSRFLDTLAAVRAELGAGDRAATIGRLLTVRAALQPDAPAILAPDRPPLSYGALRAQVDRTLRCLGALGVGRGSAVALVLPEGPELAVALLAVAAGMTCAPVNPEATATELDELFAAGRPAAVVVAAGGGSVARAVAARRGIPVVELAADPAAAAGRFALTGPAASAPAPPEGARPDDVALLLQTSGTTGRSRLVPLTHTNLLASAFAARWVRGLGPGDRCLDLMRMFHISFAGDLLGTLAAGGSVVCPPGFDAERVFDWLVAFRPTWYMAPPPIQRAILDRAPDRADAVAHCRLRFIRAAGAALPDDLRAGLEATFGVPVLQGYGMTEAGPLIANEPPPPFPRKLGSVGVVVGPELEIRGEGGERLPAGAVGEIVIRGPNVIRGYAGDPDADAEAFTAGGWFRTGDLGSLDADGYLFLAGRLKELINRGGQKVSPWEVEAALLAHPAVAEAVVFAVPDGRMGEEVAAAAVPRPGSPVDAEALRRFAASRLAPFKVPRRIVVVEALPSGSGGKRRRAELAELLRPLLAPAEPTPLPALVAPRTPLEATIAGIWAEVLGHDGVGVEDEFLALGGDSLTATRIVARLRQTLPVDLSVAAFFDAPTVAAMAAVVENLRWRPAGTVSTAAAAGHE